MLDLRLYVFAIFIVINGKNYLAFNLINPNKRAINLLRNRLPAVYGQHLQQGRRGAFYEVT